MAKKMTVKNTAGTDTQKDVPTAHNQDLAKRELTQEETERLARYERLATRKPIKFKLIKAKNNKVHVDYEEREDPLLCAKLAEAYGTADSDLQQHLLDQMGQTFKGVCSSDSIDNEIAVAALNKSMGMLSGIQPQNELEGMLAVQMIGVHNIAMRTMGLVMLGGQTLQGKEGNANIATKMLRTFIAQMEALQKIRTGGQQKMTIKHVHVNEGGQAIVGTVNQGGVK